MGLFSFLKGKSNENTLNEIERIQYLKNNNKVVFVVFTGALHRLGMYEPPFEFVKSLHGKGCDVLFLRDIQRA